MISAHNQDALASGGNNGFASRTLLLLSAGNTEKQCEKLFGFILIVRITDFVHRPAF
jgi:hypothetical protein